LKIDWLGHSAFKIDMAGTIIFIDPWINNNTPKKYKLIEKADIVCVSHDHDDHGFDDAINICKVTGATFVGIYELSNIAQDRGVGEIATGNIGGSVCIGTTNIYFTQAIHSSSVGVPCGFIIQNGGETVYFTGDTAFFSDMKYYRKKFNIDILILPICAESIMNIEEAKSVIESIRPQYVIPCHYDVFQELWINPKHIAKSIVNIAKPQILVPGTTWESPLCVS
jgi:L-ascorbate metabolism protein UlaG (beta-lactamase superfamily)